jgi:hypothetical protein
MDLGEKDGVGIAEGNKIPTPFRHNSESKMTKQYEENLRWEIACLNFPDSWISRRWDIAGLVPEAGQPLAACGLRSGVDVRGGTFSQWASYDRFSYSARASQFGTPSCFAFQL